MIKINLLLLGIALLASNVNGQTLKEKMQAKMNEVKNDLGGSKEPLVLDERDQKEIIEKHWESKEYKIYYEDSRLEYANKKLNLEKGSKDYIEFVWLGEGPKHSASFITGTDFSYCFSKDAMSVFCFTERSLICYSVKRDPYGVPEATMGYVVTKVNYVMGEFIKNRKALEYVNAQRAFANAKIEGDREALIQAEKDRRAKYTLEGKTISKIEHEWIDNPGKSMRIGKSYNIGVIVTFADGSIDKTHNIGGNLYACDFHISGTNASHGYFNSEYRTSGYGKITVGGSLSSVEPSFGGKDIATFKISSKYDKETSMEFTFNIDYPAASPIYQTGQGGNSSNTSGSGGGRAGNGVPLEIQLTSYKHSETGEKIYIYKSYDPWLKTTKYGRFTGTSLAIDVSGGNGSPGNDGRDKWTDESGKPGAGGDGGNGGNGGNVKITVDPSATSVTITCDTSAGSGGSGGSGGMCHGCLYGSSGDKGSAGSSGSSGSVDKSTAKVTF